MMHPKMNNIFELRDGYHFELRGKETGDDLKDLFASGEYQVTEERILNALFAYRFLNRYNLTRIVNRGDIKRHIDKMVSQGMIEEYVLADEKGNREENSLIAYQLSKKADRYLLESKKRGYRRCETPSDEEIINTIRINQYHIGMVLANRDEIRLQRVHFVDTYREVGTIRIPSYIVLRNRLSILALPVFEKDEDFTAFLRMLLKLAGYLKEKDHAAPLILWVATSNRAVTEGMEKIKQIKELKEMPVSYILDYNTKSGNPIQQICFAERKDHQRIELSRMIL